MTLNLDASAIRRLLVAYNTGYYRPARKSNVEADGDAYRLFACGLASDFPGLVRQLEFIGRAFGGAKVVDFDKVARVIAERILADTGYHAQLAALPSIEIAALPAPAIHRALAPFVALPPNVGSKRNFPVWASKVLHFARLDVFPVLDSAAKLALRLAQETTYSEFVASHRQPYLDTLAALRALADVDPQSPTLLRRFDKVLYQRGLQLKADERARAGE